MYKEHKLLLISIFVIVFFIALYFRIDYQRISSDVISIISVFMGIYAISISGLIGSELSKKMKKAQDNKCRTKTELGVLTNYFKYANIIAIMTIILSCITNIIEVNINYKVDIYIFYSVCTSLLSINFYFALLIIKFILDIQVRE